MAMMGMQTGSITFARMAMALAGAGISVWGAQRMCDEKIAALTSGGGGGAPSAAYEKCVKSVPSGITSANWRARAPAACGAKYPPTKGKAGAPSMLNKVLFWGGFAVIVASVMITWLLGSQMFSGMGMGMMGGGMGGYGGGMY